MRRNATLRRQRADRRYRLDEWVARGASMAASRGGPLCNAAPVARRAVERSVTADEAPPTSALRAARVARIWRRRQVTESLKRPGLDAGTVAGSSSTNSAPPPGALAARTLPPCCSATWRTIASPSPEPGRPREDAPR